MASTRSSATAVDRTAKAAPGVAAVGASTVDADAVTAVAVVVAVATAVRHPEAPAAPRSRRAVATVALPGPA